METAKEVAGKSIGKYGLMYITLIVLIGVGSSYFLPEAAITAVMTMIGGALLWVGWFGFNAGSALAAGGNAGIVMINTHAAASSAAVTWVVLEWVLRGKPSLLGAVSGAIAGLVVITPSCGYVTVGSALLLGVCGGAVCYWAVGWLKQKLGYDDALDVFGVDRKSTRLNSSHSSVSRMPSSA